MGDGGMVAMYKAIGTKGSQRERSKKEEAEELDRQLFFFFFKSQPPGKHIWNGGVPVTSSKHRY